MLVWMSTEAIRNDRSSSVGSSALGREPFPILLVETAAWNAHLFAEQLDGEIPGKLHDYLVLFLPIGMNFFSAPTPSTR